MAYGHRRYQGPRHEVFGYKRGMTTILNEDGTAIGVTLIELAPATVVRVKTPEAKDGYSAVQVGMEPVAAHRLTKAERGHLAAASQTIVADGNGKAKVPVLPSFRLLKELRDPAILPAVGDTLPSELFQPGHLVNVQGTSKGKGFAGVVKRYHFHGQDRTHGVSQVHRKPMTGGATDAARTMPGSKRPGHMGNETVTVRNLRIVARQMVGEPENEREILAIEGAVPGPAGQLVKLSYQGEYRAKIVIASGQRVGQQKQKKKK